MTAPDFTPKNTNPTYLEVDGVRYWVVSRTPTESLPTNMVRLIRERKPTIVERIYARRGKPHPSGIYGRHNKLYTIWRHVLGDGYEWYDVANY